MSPKCKTVILWFVLSLLVTSLDAGRPPDPALDPGENDTVQLSLTEHEKTWIKAHPVIRLGQSSEFEPLLIRTETGELQGIIADFFELLGKRIGVQFELIDKPWQEILRMAKNKELDGVANLSPPAAEQSDLLMTRVHNSAHPTVYGMRNLKRTVNSLDDLRGLKVAYCKSIVHFQEYVKKHKGEFEVIEADAVRQAMQYVLEGKADVMLGFSFDNYHLVGMSFTGIEILHVSTRLSVNGVTGVRPDWPELVGILNKAIESLSKEELHAIFSRWTGAIEPVGAVDLTPEEKQWLHDHPVIRVGSDSNWAPLEFMGEDGTRLGVSAEYLKKISQMLGVTFEFAEAADWNELAEKTKNKEIDLLSSIVDSPRRREYLEFTQPYLSLPIVVFAKDDAAYLGNLDYLAGEKTAVVAGYFIHRLLEENYPEIRLVLTENIEQSFQKLQNNEVYAVVDTLVVGGYYLSKLGYTNIKVVGESPFSYELSMGVRKDWAVFAGILWKTLDAIPEADRHALSQKWFSVKYEQGFDYALLWKIAFGLLAVIAFFIWSNRRLRRAVKIRTYELAESEEKYRALYHNAQAGLMRSRLSDGKAIECNQKIARIFGYDTREECIAQFVASERYVDPELRSNIITQLKESGEIRDVEAQLIRRDGTHVWISLSARLYPQKGYMESVVVDITDRKRAEEERVILEGQLRQAQKMEAVGQLAGGVAHDFNNLLGAIIGYTELMRMKLPAEDALQKNLDEVMKASHRATALVRQLLAFSRRDTLQRQTLDLNQLVSNLIKILRRVIGENIDLRFHNQPELNCVNADPGQLEQIIMNLCVNARDAMEEGGTLCIETENVEITEEYSRMLPGSKPGTYVILSVSDTGRGIEPEIRDRIFEPFFTTKDVDKGTGLGLATVYAIVKRHKGFVNLYSEVGYGTTFKIYIPIIEAAARALEEKKIGVPAPLGKGETILLAEDEDQLRDIAVLFLEDAGYRVLTARDGEEAIEVYKQHENDIDIGLLDVIMPRKSGRRVYEFIHGENPGLPIVFTSGYSFQILEHGHLPEEGYVLINKPFNRDQLLTKVREALDRA